MDKDQSSEDDLIYSYSSEEALEDGIIAQFNINFKESKFKTGKLYITHGVIDEMEANENFIVYITNSLKRHVAGDWGDLGVEDKQANDRALLNNTRIFSAYSSDKFQKIWIITEHDRSYTTILFPSEY